MKICLVCNKSQTCRWHKGPTCHACYYKAYHANKQAICIQCHTSKSIKWYKGPKCNDCRYSPERRKNQHLANREHNLNKQKAWRQNNVERKKCSDKKFREENPEYINNYLKIWYKKHPEKKKRYTRKLKEAIPPWVDHSELRRIYDNCPEGYQVDHIIPIRNKIVSGLYVPWNLQYLTPLENQRKSNKLLETYLNSETVNLSLFPIGNGK